MPQVTPKRTRYVVPIAGAAPLVIRCTTVPMYILIFEDPAANAGVAQGLQGFALDPFAVSTNLTGAGSGAEALPAGVSSYEFGDKYHVHSHQSPLGNPGSAGNTDVPGDDRVFLGTPIAALNSNTATATAVWVEEWV